MPVDLQFLHTGLFVLALLIAVIVFLYWKLQKTRQQALDKFGNTQQFIPRSAFYQNLKVVFLCLSLLFIVLSLMGPQGNAHYLNVKTRDKKAGEIILLFDVSDSMSVLDTRTGVSRLNKAKEILKDFIVEVKGADVSLFAFTSQLIPIVPETMDTLFVRLMIDQLKINEGGVAGTDFSKSLEELRSYIETQPIEKVKTVILLSDGGDTLLETLDGLQKQKREEKILSALKGLDVKVLTVGIGSKNPETIPNLSYQGKPVKTKLQKDFLQKLGTFHEANERTSMDLAKQLISEIPKMQSASASLKGIVYDLYFQVPLFLSILFLLGAILIPETEKRETV